MITPIAVLADAGLTDGSVTDGTDAATSDGGLTSLCRASLPSYETTYNGTIMSCELVTADGGSALHVVYTPYCYGGRRPDGLLPPVGPGRSSELAHWLACSAHLEAASIDAFLILARELEAHQAPAILVQASRAAARDELRHAAAMSWLALRRGSKPPVVQVTRGKESRSLEDIAHENAAEGCVRETFAALVACRQAAAASDPSIRRVMGEIAHDEIRHASLSWAVDRWASGMLGRSARRRLQDARRETVEKLLREVSTPISADLRKNAGLPGKDEGVAIMAVLRASALAA